MAEVSHSAVRISFIFLLISSRLAFIFSWRSSGVASRKPRIFSAWSFNNASTFGFCASVSLSSCSASTSTGLAASQSMYSRLAADGVFISTTGDADGACALDLGNLHHGAHGTGCPGHHHGVTGLDVLDSVEQRLLQLFR